MLVWLCIRMNHSGARRRNDVSMLFVSFEVACFLCFEVA